MVTLKYTYQISEEELFCCYHWKLGTQNKSNVSYKAKKAELLKELTFLYLEIHGFFLVIVDVE